MPSKKLIVIGGPTASGKTALAIKIAQQLKTEIVNADSRQVYAELDIGVAKPSIEELNAVKHHLIGTHSIFEHYNTGRYEKEALHCLNQVFSKSDFAILSGGTGLYIKSVLHGLDEFEEDPEQVLAARHELNTLYETEGLKSMADLLIEMDPEAANTIALTNPHRVLRALEQIKIHQKPLKEIRQGKTKERGFEVLNFFLNPNREILYQNINARVDKMLALGLEEEVRRLYPHKELKALQTVGYSEFFDFFDGHVSKEEAIEKIKQHTRNYAKRQVTYFRNVLKALPLETDNPENTIFAAL